jgi:ribosomal protein L29
MTTTTKHVREMDETEKAETLARLKRGPAPEPMAVDRLARDMSSEERAEWLREYKRRLAG